MAVSSAYRWLSFFASRASACVSGWDELALELGVLVDQGARRPRTWRLLCGVAFGPNAINAERRVTNGDVPTNERRRPRSAEPASYGSYLEPCDFAGSAVFLA